MLKFHSKRSDCYINWGYYACRGSIMPYPGVWFLLLTAIVFFIQHLTTPLLAVMSSLAFPKLLWMSFGLMLFCSQQECVLCAFSGIISGSLSLKLLQCTHLMSAKLEGNGQVLQRFQKNYSYFCCFIYFLNNTSTEDGWRKCKPINIAIASQVCSFMVLKYINMEKETII